MKDAVATMGGVLPDDASGRDAVHVAVFSAFASVKLFPGQDIGIVSRGPVDAEVGTLATLIAIVDPFLKSAVMPGQRFWAYLYPRTITGLSHRWSHPAFEATDTVYAVPSAKLASEQWVRQFADSVRLHYDTLMEGADEWVASKKAGAYGEYLCFGGLLEGETVPDAFWPHYEVLRETSVEDDFRGSFFTCSC